MLITFEGGDGAGKTTLMDRVFAELKNKAKSVLRTRAPGGTPIGESIRHLLLHSPSYEMSQRCELFLFLADRAQHVEECIIPALNRGDIVLCDRFNDSTMAYQSGARGFNSTWVEQLCAFACQQIQPHLTLYLDLDPAIGLSRVQKLNGQKDRIESEAIAFHETIRQAFHVIAIKEPNRFFIIDASQSPDEVFHRAMEKINALLTPTGK